MRYQTTIWAAGVAALLGLTTAQAQTDAQKREAAFPTVKALTMMASDVPCSDIDRSIAFYTKGLGMTFIGKFEIGPLVEVTLMFPGGGANLMLQHLKTEGEPLPVRGMLNRLLLVTPDIKNLEAQLTAAGYHLKSPIREQPQNHVANAQLEDPDGNAIEVVQRTP